MIPCKKEITKEILLSINKPIKEEISDLLEKAYNKNSNKYIDLKDIG